MPTDTLYDRDFALWAEQQGEELRRAAREGSNLPLDWDNLAEEIESLGRSERREVRSLVGQIIAHLVKLAYSPALDPRRRWMSELSLFRRQLELCLEDSPSLRKDLPELVQAETPRALAEAIDQLEIFGESEAAKQAQRQEHVFTTEEVLNPRWFLPGSLCKGPT